MFGRDTQDQSQTQADTNNGTHDEQPTVVPSSLMGQNDDAPVSPAATSSAPDLPGTLPTPGAHAAASTEGMTTDELLTIKQEALQHLSPLVGHLEQSPEEKFRTTMMMIQASDDQTLIKAAYEAAKQISDEKARAQALLDVVNEINYFTQQHN
jgi:hypothetical protein